MQKSNLRFHLVLSKILILGFLCILPLLLKAQINLSRIPIETSTNSLELLKKITEDHRYKACYSDLSAFIQNLRELTLTEGGSKEDGITSLHKIITTSPLNEKKLREIFKKGLKEISSKAINEKDIIYDEDDFKTIHTIIDHGSFKCKLSIITMLSMDPLKVSLNPESADVKIEVGNGKTDVQATLIGASYDFDENILHYDPSKALKLMGDSVPSLMAFQEWEAEQNKSSPSNNKTQPQGK